MGAAVRSVGRPTSLFYVERLGLAHCARLSTDKVPSQEDSSGSYPDSLHYSAAQNPLARGIGLKKRERAGSERLKEWYVAAVLDLIHTPGELDNHRSHARTQAHVHDIQV